VAAPETTFRSFVDLEADVDHVLAAPRDLGTLSLIVRRPSENEREILDVGHLDLTEGLNGDSWRTRANPATIGLDTQLNVASARAMSLIAGATGPWELAGDQLYLDFDIGEANLPTGSRLSIGDCVIEVSQKPHRGCQKFSRRFGPDALRFVNSEVGQALRLRGFNARVVVPGDIRTGDIVRKQP